MYHYKHQVRETPTSEIHMYPQGYVELFDGEERRRDVQATGDTLDHDKRNDT